MRLAYFSPLSPTPSGISAYSEELLPYLAHYAELDLFFAGDRPSNPQLCEQFALYPIQHYPQLQRRRKYDTVFYQMGNSIYHTDIYKMMHQHPGITLLHEHMLHDFFLAMTGEGNGWISYWRELAYNTTPEFMRWIRLDRPARTSHLPLAQRVVDLSLGLIVLNQEMARRVLMDAPSTRVGVVPMGMPAAAQPASAQERLIARQRLNLAPDNYLIATFGQLSPHKRLDKILEAFARLLHGWPQAKYVLIGRNAGDYDLSILLEQFDLPSDAVIITGFVSPEKLVDYIQAMDLFVNLRYPVYGETSAAVLRLMGYGKPIIVSDVVTFSHLPAESCIKVPVDAQETEFLYRSLLLLAQRPDLRTRLGRNAWRYVNDHHHMPDAARQLATAIERILREVERGNQRGFYYNGLI